MTAFTYRCADCGSVKKEDEIMHLKDTSILCHSCFQKRKESEFFYCSHCDEPYHESEGKHEIEPSIYFCKDCYEESVHLVNHETSERKL